VSTTRSDQAAEAAIGGVRAAVETIAAEAPEVDAERRFPSAGLRALADAGALGLVVSPEHGGAGGGLAALAGACEAVGRACGSTALVFLMHNVTAATFQAGGGPAASELLPRMASGELLGTLAFSERGTGAHFYSPELQAVRSNGGVRVDGRKSFVTSSDEAEVYLVLLAGDDGAPDCYVVRRDQPGISFDGEWRGLGMAGNNSIAMVFDGVELDDSARVGQPGAGAALVFDVVAPFFLVGLAAANAGIAAAAAEAATARAAAPRYSDGSKLAEIQHVQHLVADMDGDVRAARLAVEDAARLGDAGDAAALVAIMGAKVRAADTAVDVARRAMEVCGGQGYTRGMPVERHMRDALAATVMAPTNAVLRSWIGKALTGLPVP
jgi:alkylation response protein AidB-like acyl-CoA dehydrogenase